MRTGHMLLNAEERIEELETKLGKYINMRNELINMVNIKNDKITELEEQLKQEQIKSLHYMSEVNIRNNMLHDYETKLTIATEALKKIKHENLDDKTPTRYIKALQEWRDKACKISWEALAKIKG